MINNISPRQYEIWVTDLGDSVGSEPGKIRPVVILQSDLLNRLGHPSTIACGISSQLRDGGSVLRLPIEPTQENGLKKPSYILCDLLRAIDLSRLNARIGTLDEDTILLIKQSLAYILDLH